MKKKRKVIFLFLDGLPDIPVDGKTPLTEANKPNIDWFAKNGTTGELLLLDKSHWVNPVRAASISPFANMALMGYDPTKFPVKRGVLEAVGADISFKEGYLALRCNFATVDENLKVIDRRAGRNTYGLSDLVRYINEHLNIGVPFIFKRTYEHRAVLVIKMNLSDAVTGNDTTSEGLVKRVSAEKPDGLITAKIIQDFIDKTHKLIDYHKANEERIKNGIPPANYLLVREAGNKLRDLLPHFTTKHKINKAVCISEPGSVKATCMLAGMDAITVPEITDEGKINYRKTMDFVFGNIELTLPEYDLVYAHIKETDVAAHDKDFDRRVEAIEAVDAKLEPFRKTNSILVITSDHITSTEAGKHEYGKVPVLVYGKGKDNVKAFDETSVKKGKLKNYNATKLWKYIFK